MIARIYTWGAAGLGSFSPELIAKLRLRSSTTGEAEAGTGTEPSVSTKGDGVSEVGSSPAEGRKGDASKAGAFVLGNSPTGTGEARRPGAERRVRGHGGPPV